ncbi:MAG: hypothetical protein SF182_21330 [Deltaproteobacteria bacterium]|nr:hypothetical protein [Deltaproteobacteria bacterium]
MTGWRRGAALALLVVFLDAAGSAAQVLIAANSADNSAGQVMLRRGHAPWRARATTLATGADTVLALGPRGQLAALSRASGELIIADATDLRPRRRIPLGAGAQLEDVSLSDACTAWLTRRNTGALLRVDFCGGAVRTHDSVDLSPFADADGNPDLGALFVDGDHLFVQVRRRNEDAPLGHALPAYLAVVDLRSEQLVDTDPLAPGVQLITLSGTAPKHRMQIQPGTRRLLVSASGGFFDAGGLEAVNLDTLRSEGLLIREADGRTGADLGPFIMTTASDGFLVFSTDLDLSSHLLRFSLRGGVEPGPERYVTVGYAMPALVHEPRANVIFAVDGAFGRIGAHVVDASSGARLSRAPLATAGRPTDLLLLGPAASRRAR